MTWAMTELDRVGCAVLADAIGETPETVMSVHQLRRGLCRSLVLGPPDRPEAAVTQAHSHPAEPTGFGNDPDQLWTLLRPLDQWSAVNVSCAVGPSLAELVERDTGRACWLCDETYYTLDRPVIRWTHPAVRHLTLADVDLLERSTADLDMAGWRFGSAEALVAEGSAAGAVVEDRLVAVAFTAARGDRHVGVGIVTAEPWRGRGLATAAAVLVCGEIQRAGQLPVWSTSVDNSASRRVAAKLGFSEVSRRVYVNQAPPLRN